MRQQSNPGQIDALEERRLLSAAIVGGVLKITGSGGDDQIVLRKTTTSIILTINGHSQSFASRKVRSIRVDGGRGNDSINDAVNVPATLLGSGGNDKITGGAADDSINGGAGKDTLNGGKG